jgi:hypothetical protein
MKKLGLFGAAIALTLGVFATAPGDVDAKPAAKQAAPSEPAKLEKAPKLKPTLFKFGMGHKKVLAVYDKVIDQDYLKKFEKVEPGIQMERLQHEIRSKKEAVLRSYTPLDAPPSSLDSTPFVGEFTYYNDEAFLRVTRVGRTRTIFFIKDKAWKTIDVHKLGSSSAWGENFEAAVEKVEKKLGVKARRIAANPETGQRAEADWADDTVHFRMIDWAEGQLGIAYVDKATEARLPELRKNTGPEKGDIDQEVKDVLRQPKG